MLMDGDALMRHLMQLSAPCRKCGTTIQFEEGGTLAIEKGIHDQVIMCRACGSIYTVDMAPGRLSLVADVTEKYAPAGEPAQAEAPAEPEEPETEPEQETAGVTGGGAPTPPAAWYPDPHRRHEMRYWDGVDWTEHVSDQTRVSVDPIG
jgi:hypothetical protein